MLRKVLVVWKRKKKWTNKKKMALYQSVTHCMACGAGSKNITIALISRAVDR